MEGVNDYTVSTDISKLDIAFIHQYLSTEAYWCKDIPVETIKVAIANSLNFGVYDGEKQIGFARIISDYSTFAYLADVFIIPAYRGRGLSKLLLRTIMNHPSLQGLRRWLLGTLDAHNLYEQFGWHPVASPERWMEIHNKNIYTT